MFREQGTAAEPARRIQARSATDRRGTAGAAGRAAWRALLLLVLSACGEAGGGEPASDRSSLGVSAVDDTGREVRLPRPARRVVALVPGATETLVALGARDRLVARTQYDTAPVVQDLPSVGGGLDPSEEVLLSLRPDLVVAWEEEKGGDLRRRLEGMGIPVFAVRTRDTTDVFHNLERLGRLVGRDRAADSVAAALRAQLGQVRASVEGRPRPSVLYVVWNDPPMTAGPETFLAQVIGVAGGQTIFPDLRQDWPQVSMEEIVRRDPDVVVLPVGEDPAHSLRRLLDAPGWRELRAVREGRVVEVPADLMNRPGPRLGEAARVMRDALHPRRRSP